MILKIEKLKKNENLNIYYYWIIKINFWILKILKKKKNMKFLDFFLFRILDFDFFNFLNEKKKIFFSKIYFEFSEFLKSDSENIKKNQNKYIKYLLFSLKIISNIKIRENPKNEKISKISKFEKNENLEKFENLKNEEIIYLNYIIKFHIGLYYKNIENYEFSKKYFEKSIILYEKLKNRKIQEKIVIIFYLGIIFYKLKNFENSKIFFLEIFEKKIKDKKLKNQILKYLIKIFYFLEDFSNCKKFLNFYFLENSEKIIKNKYLVFYVILLIRQNLDFNQILKELKNLENFEKKKNSEKNEIFLFFRNIIIYYKKNKIQNEEFSIFENFQNFEKIFDLEKSEDFLKKISYLYNLFIFEKKNNNYSEILFEFLKKKNNKEILNFFRIIFLFFCFYIKFLKKSKKSNFLNFYENYKKLKNEDILKTIKNFKIQKKQKFFFSEKILKSWDLKNKKNCNCYKKIKNSEILNLIEKFFFQIKNMLFLNLTEKILIYYEEFSKIIKKKKYNIKNFDYIPKLFNFFEKSEKNGFFEKFEFFEILKKIFNEKICIHDFEIIFLLFESFRNKKIFENAIFIIHENFPKLAKYLFKNLFFENFSEKFEKIIFEFLNFSKKSNFAIIENSPLIHNLKSKKILEISKNDTFHFFYKFRYFSLNEKNLEEIFKIYFSEFEIMNFKIKFQFYIFFVKIIRNKINSLEILNNFEDRIFYFLKIYKKNFFEIKNIFYVFLTFCNLLDFKNYEKKISLKIFSILKKFFDFCKKKNFVDFIISSNFIANIFFKHKIFDLSFEIKNWIFLILKKEKIKKIIFPKFLKSKNLKQIKYDIISYLLISSIFLKNQKNSQFYYEIFQKLKKSENKFFEVEKIFLKIEFLKFQKKTKSINFLLNSTQKKFNKFENFEKNIFQALFFKNKIFLQNIQNKESDLNFENKRRTSLNFVHNVLETEKNGNDVINPL